MLDACSWFLVVWLFTLSVLFLVVVWVLVCYSVGIWVGCLWVSFICALFVLMVGYFCCFGGCLVASWVAAFGVACLIGGLVVDCGLLSVNSLTFAA